MRTRIRSFVVELGTLLGPDDPRWDAFGLSRPSDPDTPLPATSFTATPAGPGNLLYKWKRAKRATYYRLFYKVLTVDADFHQHEPNPPGPQPHPGRPALRRHRRSLPHRRQRSRRSRGDRHDQRSRRLAGGGNDETQMTNRPYAL